MFFIGTNVMFEPLQALRAAQDGHEICVRECCALNSLRCECEF
jgi:hypothetical protein